MRHNEIFLFPFEKIEKGSNIIIYGMGTVGRCFYAQITSMEYCKMVAAVDRDADKFGAVRYNLINPEEINKYNYDYIVIAIDSAETGNQIKNELTSRNNIPEAKIVFEPNRKSLVCLSDTNLEHWMHSVEIMEKELDAFWLSNVGNVNYFSNIIDEITNFKLKLQEKEISEIKKFFLDYLHSNASVKDKIVILQILYLADCFDKEFMKLFISNVSQLDNYEARMWMAFDISIIELNTQSCRYADYYLDKRKLMEDNAFHFYHCTSNKHTRTKNNKVAIVSVRVGSERTSHNQLIIPYANEMARQGKEVTIFPVDLFRYRYEECFILPIFPRVQKSETYKEIHKRLFDPKITIVYNQGKSFRERISYFMEQLIEYDPYVVYDFCGEYSFLSPLIHKLFYVVAMPMRGYTSSACFDKYVCRDKQICIHENNIYHSVKEEQMVDIHMPIRPLQTVQGYRRADFNLPEDAFIITTVGYRLKKELTPEFIDCVCEFLKEHRNACWILVGEKINNYFIEYHQELVAKKQIIAWGYEMNLQAFYAMCDIYWNPDRMGAAGSMGLAMKCGMPIVTTTYPSDILPRLGMENAINGGYDECKKYVERLYNDPAFYREKSQLMKDRMSISTVENTMEEYISKLLEVGETW